MYVEAAAALEALTTKAYSKITAVYEKRMFKEGKLAGQVTHLLHTYCAWEDSALEQISKVLERRNQVVHDQKRAFDAAEAFEHISIAEKATESIKNWLSL
jgi:hypothetical protein